MPALACSGVVCPIWAAARPRPRWSRHTASPAGRPRCSVRSRRVRRRIWVTDDHKRAGLGHFVEVGDALRLCVAVVHQPVPRPRGSAYRIGVERLMAVEQDLALEVQELERREADAGEFLERGERRVRPGFGPVGPHENNRPFRDATVFFPGLDVGDLQRVVGVLLDLRDDRDDDQRPDGVGRRQLVDGRIFRRPMGRRVELRAKLIGPQVVLGRFEAVLLVGLDFALLDEALDIRASARARRWTERNPPRRGSAA